MRLYRIRKVSIIAKKSNPLVQIIIASHLAYAKIIAKCLRCDCHPWI